MESISERAEGVREEEQVKVAVRIRPLNESEKRRESGLVVHAPDEGRNVVEITKPGRKGAVLRSEMGCRHRYSYDAVFGPSISQRDVYERTAKPLVEQTLDGVNSTIFAYGATGSGKTFTMLGLDANNNLKTETLGIIPQAVEDIFLGIQARKKKGIKDWGVYVSYLEVYNESIFDLLSSRQRPLLPCEDPVDHTVKVLGLTERTVNDVSEVISILDEGNRRRRMASTKANEFSSRSHAVLQIKIISKGEASDKSSAQNDTGSRLRSLVCMTTSRISLIDLAGSERAANTQNRGTRLREGASINKSLLALANCFNALSAKGRNCRVKYRDSKLTHLLKSSLEGNCKLCMIATINPATSVYEESHNTLKYADRAKTIRLKPIQVERLEIPRPRETRTQRSAANRSARRLSEQSVKKRRISLDHRSKGAEHASKATKRRYSSVCYRPPPTPRTSIGRSSRPPRVSADVVSTAGKSSQVSSIREEAALAELEHLKLQNRTLATLAANVFERSGVDLRIEDISSLVQTAVKEAMSNSDCEIDRLCSAYSAQRAQKSNIPKFNSRNQSSSPTEPKNSAPEVENRIPEKAEASLIPSRRSTSCIPLASRMRVSNRLVGKLYRS